MDKLEKFILGHREEFKEYRRPEKGWNELENKMNPQKSDWSILWKVAAVFFLATTLILTAFNFSAKNITQMSSASHTDSLEDFFVELINHKRSVYFSLADKSDREELFQDLIELDSAYTKLKSSYKQLESEELLQAMLENLQLRVYILNEQIEILKNNNVNKEEVYLSS